MQLKSIGSLAAGLSALSANLLAVAPAMAQADAAPGPMQETAAPAGSIQGEASVLFYQEKGGRVRAVEPVINLAINRTNGDVVNGSLTYDSLTGATPNGAAPWTETQTFTSVLKPGTTTTGASGTIGGGPGAVTSSYTQPAGRIPLSGFHDHRTAGNVGYSWLVDPDTRLKFGGAISVETDYKTWSGNIALSRDFNQKNTTLTLAGSYERDSSNPHIGTPKPFQRLDSQITGTTDHKTIITLLAGVTQTMSRTWLTQLNYSFSSDNGYNSDPYRIISAVNDDGSPLLYLFESRPRARHRHSVVWSNKVAVGPTVVDASVRYYHDSWGIDSVTLELADQVPIGKRAYVKPVVRYYSQSAADFYAPYLTGVRLVLEGAGVHNAEGEGGGMFIPFPPPTIIGLPGYGSSDARLSKFHAVTLGGRFGLQLAPGTEFYVDGEVYRQYGAHHFANAPGALARLDIFSGVRTVSVMTGVRFRM